MDAKKFIEIGRVLSRLLGPSPFDDRGWGRGSEVEKIFGCDLLLEYFELKRFEDVFNSSAFVWRSRNDHLFDSPDKAVRVKMFRDSWKYGVVQDSPVNPWGWVRLSDVARVVGTKPWCVWRRYFNLSKDAPQYGDLAWLPDLNKIMIRGRRPASGEWNQVWVPAGWASDVVTAYEKGVHHVVLSSFEQMLSEKDIPAGALSTTFVDGYWKAAMGYDAHGK